MNGLPNMLLPEVTYVDGDGDSWRYNIEHGFTIRVDIRLISYDPTTGRNNSREAREACYRRYRKRMVVLCERRKVDWNMRSWKHTHREAHIYCNDLTWLMMARLKGYDDLYNNIVAINQLRGTTCIL